MPVSGDPDAGSFANQGHLAPNVQQMPGGQPLGRIRAKITAADGQTPPTFTWIEQEPDLNGNLVDKIDGMTGSPEYNPARELNGQTPPSYPWIVWLTPREDLGSLGVMWDFDLKCCTVNCCALPIDDHWPDTMFLTILAPLDHYPACGFTPDVANCVNTGDTFELDLRPPIPIPGGVLNLPCEKWWGIQHDDVNCHSCDPISPLLCSDCCFIFAVGACCDPGGLGYLAIKGPAPVPPILAPLPETCVNQFFASFFTVQIDTAQCEPTHLIRGRMFITRHDSAAFPPPSIRVGFEFEVTA